VIYPGSEVRISASFRLTATGALADPTTITLKIKSPRCTEYTYTTGQIIKDAVGQYHYDFQVPDNSESAGEWKYRWTGTGAAVGVVEGKFNVRCSAFTD